MHIGGLSYLSGRYGFACNNVARFEIVLGSGELTEATPDKNQDLFQALQGGSNNFGIVAQFDLKTVNVADVSGGYVVYNISEVPKALQAFHDFNAADPYDEYASTTQTVAYIESTGLVGMNDFAYAKPILHPQAFDGWDTIEDKTEIDLRIASVKNITDTHGSRFSCRS